MLTVKHSNETIRLYELINAINGMLFNAKNEVHIFEEICRIVNEEGSFQSSWIGLFDKETGIINPLSCTENADWFLENLSFHLNDFENGKALVVNDILRDSIYKKSKEEALVRKLASSISLPIKKQQKIIGIFNLYSRELNFFDEPTIEQLNALSITISFALDSIENKNLLLIAENEIISKNNFLDTMTTAIPGIIAYWNKDLICIFTNKGYIDWLGVNSQNFVGLHLSEIMDDELFALNQPYIKNVLDGKLQQFERKVTRSNGKIEYIFAQFIPHILNNQVEGFYVVGSNITKIKATEQLLLTNELALKETASKYHSLLEDMNEGVLIISHDYTYLFANTAAIRHRKIPKVELIGRKILELKTGIENSNFFDRIKHCMKNRNPETFETEFEYPDGSLEWFEIRLTPVPEGVLLLSLRITARKKIAAEFDLATKTNEEERLFESSRMSALGYMASGIAHEINNPLTIITLKLSQLIRKINSGSLQAEELETGLHKVASTAERIGKVVRGLSSISRNSENDPMVKVKLKTTIEETLQLCHERFKTHSVTLTANIAEISDIEIKGRASQIMQVLLNLLNNAMDAIMGSEEMWVSIKAVQGEFGAIISVTDSGKGIPKQLHTKLMEPFFTTKEAEKGTGLGLSISKKIIDEHQGKLYLKENSANTCFVIELPYFE